MTGRVTNESHLGPGVSLLLSMLAAFSIGCEALQPPTAPTAAPTAATPGRHDVTIVGEGVVLGGVLFRPEATETRPALIVLHGWLPAGTSGATTVEARARRYADDGYATLALSLRGWPPSGGADDCGLVQAADVVDALRWLRSQPGVDRERIGLVGFSQGGQVALLAAARDASVRAVVAYYPVTDVARWKITTASVDIPSYVSTICEPGGVAPRSPLLRAAEISAVVLLVHGDRDTRVPTEQSRLFHGARTQGGRLSELLLVPGAQHGFTSAEEGVVRPVVDRFLSIALQ